MTHRKSNSVIVAALVVMRRIAQVEQSTSSGAAGKNHAGLTEWNSCRAFSRPIFASPVGGDEKRFDVPLE